MIEFLFENYCCPASKELLESGPTPLSKPEFCLQMYFLTFYMCVQYKPLHWICVERVKRTNFRQPHNFNLENFVKQHSSKILNSTYTSIRLC